ncbi:MAG: DUF4397 domain-containing protein [Ignavibacteriae bacterium]|nr:DUF4397 domain-containing protein [Ignavibacteriota bacterium]MCB9216984.1 DUF4397 domain-containing protein [Ignavibacteria bacterium]
MRLRSHVLLSTLFSLVLIGVSAPTLFAQTDSLPKIRVVHVVPDAPAFDLYLDEITPAIFQGVRYGDASKNFQLQPGQHDAAITAANAPKETALFSQQAFANLDSAYTIFATGQVQALDIAPIVLTRSLKRVPASGRTLVRLFHASLPAGNVKVKVTDIASNETIFDNVPFRSASDYFSVPSGNIRVEVSKAGGEVFYVGTGSVTQGALLTLVGVGTPEANSFKMYVLSDNSDLAKTPMDTLRTERTGNKGAWRMIHLSPTSGNLEVGVDNASDKGVLLFRDATDVADDLDGGNHNVKVWHQGETGSEPLIDKDVEVIANAYRATYVIGDQGSGTLDLLSLTADPSALPPPGQASVRLLNAALDTALIDVRIQFASGAPRDVSSSGFRNFTSYANAAAGSATVTLTRPGAQAPFLTATGNIPADAFSTLIILGSIGDGNLSVNLLVDSDESEQAPMLKFEETSGVEWDQRIVNQFRIVESSTSETIRLQFGLQSASDISYRMYDALGKLVGSDNLGFRSSGEHSHVVDVQNVTSGLYLVTLSSGGEVVATERVYIAK